MCVCVWVHVCGRVSYAVHRLAVFVVLVCICLGSVCCVCSRYMTSLYEVLVMPKRCLTAEQPVRVYSGRVGLLVLGNVACFLEWCLFYIGL